MRGWRRNSWRENSWRVGSWGLYPILKRIKKIVKMPYKYLVFPIFKRK